MDDGLQIPPSNSNRTPLVWPPGPVPPQLELVQCACTACGQLWQVHTDLGGFRLRCICSEWVSVPGLPALAGATAPKPQIAAPRRKELMNLSRYQSPGAVGDASVDDQRRWNDRVIIELVLLLIAFTAPAVYIHFFAVGEMRALLYPIASLFSSMAILAIGALSPSYMFRGLKSAKLKYYLEALCVGVAGAVLALLYSELLRSSMEIENSEFDAFRSKLGPLLSLFVIAVCPGIFEELAFRGLLHGRLQTIFGMHQGRYITGAAFALAHGFTAGFPFHAALGVYLSILRDRSDSLIPGMLLHFVYNGIIITFL